MKACLLAAAVASRKRKIVKYHLDVFERGENFLQDGIQDFVFWLSQSPEIAFESLNLDT